MYLELYWALEVVALVVVVTVGGAEKNHPTQQTV